MYQSILDLQDEGADLTTPNITSKYQEKTGAVVTRQYISKVLLVLEKKEYIRISPRVIEVLEQEEDQSDEGSN